MIANITSGKDVNGVIMYNENKVIRGEAELIKSNHVITHNLKSKKAGFEPHNILNKNTINVVFHASLSVAIGVKFSDENFTKAAEIYMEEMGYKDQPYLVYKHNDTDHPHIHIVSSRVNKDGKKINDSLERSRSQKALDKIINLYQLPKVARRKKRAWSEDMRRSGTKNDMYKIIKHAQTNYKPTNLTEYNQFLKKYHLRIKHQKGQTEKGKDYEGLIYINSTVVKGVERINNQIMQEEICIKSSNFNNIQSLKELQDEFIINTQIKKENLFKIKKSLLPLTKLDNKLSLKQFNKFLSDRKIEVFYSKNKNGINGISFVDQKTGFYFKASEISKELTFHKLKEKINFEELINIDTNKEYKPGLNKMKDELSKKRIEAFKNIENSAKERNVINNFKVIEKKAQKFKNTEVHDIPKILKKKKRTL